MKRLLLALTLAIIAVGIAACSSGTGTDNGDATAPDFSLLDAAGRQVELSGLLQDKDALVLVFYRGFF